MAGVSTEGPWRLSNIDAAYPRKKMSHKRFVETGRSIHSILNTRNEVLAHACCVGLLLQLPLGALDVKLASLDKAG